MKDKKEKNENYIFNYKRILIIILGLVVTLAIVIEAARVNAFMSKRENDTLMDSTKLQGEKLDSEVLKNVTNEEFLIIYDEEHHGKLKDNIEITLDYMKKDFKSIDVENFSTIGKDTTHVIIATESLRKIKDFNKIMDFTFQGGSVFFAARLGPTDGLSTLASKAGIKTYGRFTETTGIEILENVMIGSKGFKVTNENEIINSSVTVELTNEAQLLAVSNDGVPLLWSNEYGKGKLMYFNGTMLGEKANRGFLSGIISSMSEDFFYPIINAKINYIDDFPSPAPTGKDEQIYEDYKRNIKDFYRDIWWPDLIALASKYDLTYTGVVIGSYDDETKEVSEEEIILAKEDFNYYTKELFILGGELGIHGYNHQPLSLNELNDRDLGYKKWRNFDIMSKSIELLSQYVEKELNNYELRAYVPPSNILTEEGVEAIRKGNPNVRILSSLYNVGASKDAYEQEIGIRENGIIDLPRTTSGYLNSEHTKWDALNAINLHGYFNHFVHPDDILDEERNDYKGWPELNKEFDAFQRDIYKTYPWLIPCTATEGANQLIKYSESDLYIEKQGEAIKFYCDNFLGTMEVIFRSEKEIKEATGCKIEKIDDGIYLIKIEEQMSEIRFKG